MILIIFFMVLFIYFVILFYIQYHWMQHFICIFQFNFLIIRLNSILLPQKHIYQKNVIIHGGVITFIWVDFEVHIEYQIGTFL